MLYSRFGSFPSRPLSPSNILLTFFIYFSSSLSSVFLETAYKWCSGYRLFICHNHYYRCPHPRVYLRVRIQAHTEKRDLNSSLRKCSGLVGFFSSQKNQVITLFANCHSNYHHIWVFGYFHILLKKRKLICHSVYRRWFSICKICPFEKGRCLQDPCFSKTMNPVPAVTSSNKQFSVLPVQCCIRATFQHDLDLPKKKGVLTYIHPILNTKLAILKQQSCCSRWNPE